MGYATRMGMMGAALGGLQYMLSEDTQRRMEEAELRKLERLRALDIDKEQREGVEWQRRQEIETQDAIRRDEIGALRDERKLATEYQFRGQERAADREHDFALEEVRTGADIQKAEHGSKLRRGEAAFDEALVRTRPVQPGDDPTRGKGLIGSDGKTYKYGEPLPPGVTVAGGYGVSFAPSASKSTAPGAGRRRPGVGEVGSTAAPVSKPGDSQANPKQVWSIEEAEAAEPGTWIRLPNGKVGQR